MSSEIDATIERRIIIGLIVSDAYIAKVSTVLETMMQTEPEWAEQIFVSGMASRLADWALNYFEEYGKAPGLNIEPLFYEKAKTLPDDVIEEFEERILPSLSQESERAEKFNLDYLLDQTLTYFKARRLQLHADELQTLMEEGRSEEAGALAAEFSQIPVEERESVYFGTDASGEIMLRAFNRDVQQVVRYPGPLGQMLNDQLVRGGFVAFMASEKSGKSFFLLDLAMKAVLHDYANVVFFDAGDMSRELIFERVGMYLTKRPKSDISEMWSPELDCLLNQTDDCEREEREGMIGLDIGSEEDISPALLMERASDPEFKDYMPCRNCPIGRHEKGSVWGSKVPCHTLDGYSAFKAEQKFFKKYKNRFKLATYPNGDLTVGKMKAKLTQWEREEGFVPDLVVVDYADLLVRNAGGDFRHRIDETWRGLRGLSQEKHCLLVTATQADAQSYNVKRLSLANFSEDKRKYSHITAMYGINRDPNGDESKMGLMRINQLMVRSGEFATTNEVYVVQNLAISRAFLTSFTRRRV